MYRIRRFPAGFEAAITGDCGPDAGIGVGAGVVGNAAARAPAKVGAGDGAVTVCMAAMPDTLPSAARNASAF